MRARGSWLLGGGAALAALAALADASGDRIHVVQPGETLWQIAAALTGDPLEWQALYRANRDQIKDPARLYPGQRLTIPERTGPAPATPPPARRDEAGPAR